MIIGRSRRTRGEQCVVGNQVSSIGSKVQAAFAAGQDERRFDEALLVFV